MNVRCEEMEKLPIGIVKATDDKYPRIISINNAMLKILNGNENSKNYEYIKDNLFFMVPYDERENLAHILQEAKENEGNSVTLRHRAIGLDDKLVNLGCIVSYVNNSYYFIYSKITEEAYDQSNYFAALENAYNVIFKVDVFEDRVSCIYGRDTSAIGKMYDAVMTIDSAISYWINNYMYEPDKIIARDFLNRVSSIETMKKENRPLQIEFRLLIHDYIETFLAVAVLLNSRNILLCVRNTSKTKYNLLSKEENSVFIRTFGHFDVFVGGKPMIFGSDKEKELLALLVDRNGGTITSSEAISYLWENEPADERMLAKYRKLAMRLMQDLSCYGIGDILQNKHGVRSIDTTKVTSDYYELLKGNILYIKQFNDQYMIDYSWAENTLSSLFTLTEK